MDADRLNFQRRKSCCTPENTSTLVVCNDSGFTVQIVSETCVQCVRHFDSRLTAGDVSIRRGSYEWSAVIVRATPARSPSAVGHGSEWRRHWTHLSPAVCTYRRCAEVFHTQKSRHSLEWWFSSQIRPTTKFHVSVCIRRVDVAPSSVLHFNIKLESCHLLLYVVYTYRNSFICLSNAMQCMDTI